MGDWDDLGAVAPERLAEARLELHWAAQAACAPGKQLLPPQADYSQQSFCWAAGPRALAQAPIAGERPFRPALRLAPPALLLLAPQDDAVLAELPLPGHTLEEAYGWLECRLPELSGCPLAAALERPGELPAHPVGEGRPFGDPGQAGEGHAELARWFATAHEALSRLAARQPAAFPASPVRCWPHHFDLAVLLPLDGPAGSAEASAETARSIGAGLSPGDAGRAEPYYYVTPWPYPGQPDLPALDGGGTWNREGWVGAVLTASSLAAGPGAGAARRRQVERFLDSAVAACRRLLSACD